MVDVGGEDRGSEQTPQSADEQVEQASKVERAEWEDDRPLEAEGLARIQQVTAVFLSDRPLTRVLEEIVDAAIAVTGADFGNVQELDVHTSELVIVAQRGFPDWW